MESRLERYKQRKKIKKSKWRQRLLLFVLLICFGLGLTVVDESNRSLLCIENSKIFDYRFENKRHRIHIFGDNYFVEQEKINTVIQDLQAKMNESIDSIKNKLGD